MQRRGAERGQAVADLAVDADVGAPEAVDRLLRIADEEQRARPRPDLPPVGLVGIVGGEQQQDLGLQRIGVLELVDEDAREARLEAAPHAGVVAHQIARAEQQIEEVERAGARLELVVAVDRAAQLALQQRGEVGVRGHPELIEARLERRPGLHHAFARDAVAVGRCRGRSSRCANVRSRDRSTSARLPAVVVRLALVFRRALEHDFVADAARRRGAGKQRIVGRRRLGA